MTVAELIYLLGQVPGHVPVTLRGEEFDWTEHVSARPARLDKYSEPYAFRIEVES